ncbi:hypothetical protein [Halalkalicoccus salilacus]
MEIVVDRGDPVRELVVELRAVVDAVLDPFPFDLPDPSAVPSSP